MSAMATIVMDVNLSPRKMNAKMIVNSVLLLSTGVTLLTSPIWIARKKQSHDAPVAKPDNIRNNNVLPDMSVMVPMDPVIDTMAHAMIRTTIVLIAVARLELTSFIPIFANMDVKPANNADNRANRIQ